MISFALEIGEKVSGGREKRKLGMKSTKFGRDTSACRCMSYRSHVTQVASDFPNKLPPRESRVPETFIDTLLCIHGHTPRGYNGPTWSSSQPLFRLFAPPAARARTPLYARYAIISPSQFITIDLCHPLCRIIWYPVLQRVGITPPFITCFALCFLPRADNFPVPRFRFWNRSAKIVVIIYNISLLVSCHPQHILFFTHY